MDFEPDAPELPRHDFGGSVDLEPEFWVLMQVSPDGNQFFDVSSNLLQWLHGYLTTDGFRNTGDAARRTFCRQ
jgi:hypothetical protein